MNLSVQFYLFFALSLTLSLVNAQQGEKRREILRLGKRSRNIIRLGKKSDSGAQLQPSEEISKIKEALDQLIVEMNELDALLPDESQESEQEVESPTQEDENSAEDEIQELQELNKRSDRNLIRLGKRGRNLIRLGKRGRNLIRIGKRVAAIKRARQILRLG